MGGAALPGVGRTAVWVAALRAAENARPDRLFDDPFAAAFVRAFGAAGDVPGSAGVPTGASEFLAIRTRFYDDQARAATVSGARQVVLLAAGLDCRAFRLDWPDGTRVFELDLPEVFAFKEPVLASAGATARCARTVVPVDLREPWADPLIAAGFDPDAATGWLVEGLLPYLRWTAAERLLGSVTGLAAPGSRVVVDYLEASAADRPAMRATSDAVRGMGAELLTTVDSPADWLGTHGWRTEIFRVPALGEDYGRPLPTEVDLTTSNATVLVAAGRPSPRPQITPAAARC
jgi:methyltransferase (TIGR00027 family)